MSIIIPHKNDADGLSRLLASIPDRADVQVIIVDDHSDIDVRSITHRKPNTTLFRSDGHGAGAARNTGLRHATGDWLLFADSGDYFTDGAFDVIDSQLGAHEQVVYFSPTARHEKDNLSTIRHMAYAALVREYLETGSPWIRYKFFPPWSKMIRKDLIVTTGINFDETPVANDVMFSLKVGVNAESIKAVDHPIYCIMKFTDKGLTNKRSSPFLRVRIDNTIRCNRYLTQAGARRYRSSMWTLLKEAWRIDKVMFLKTLTRSIISMQPLVNRYDLVKLRRRRSRNR